MDDRDRLKTTFDSAAASYHQARPDYPDALFDTLVQLARLRPGDRLAEIGCGTGKATIPLARRGYSITGIELGAELAAQARLNLTDYPSVEIVNADFESWTPPRAGSFRLVYAATAWHWIDPAIRYAKVWELLGPDGHLAFWRAWHVLPADADPFYADIQDVYNEIGEGLGAPIDTILPAPDKMPDQRTEIEETGLFGSVQVRSFDWEVIYNADQYIALHNTFSAHMTMDPAKRAQLYGEIRRRLGQRPDGLLAHRWGAVLHVARREP